MQCCGVISVYPSINPAETETRGIESHCRVYAGVAACTSVYLGVYHSDNMAGAASPVLDPGCGADQVCLQRQGAAGPQGCLPQMISFCRGQRTPPHAVAAEQVSVCVSAAFC